MTEAITSFSGKYHFLSNFWMEPFTINKTTYPSVEHGYQAQKASTPEEFQYVMDSSTPGIAKKRGKKVKLAENWENDKLEVMYWLVRKKFQHPELARLLIETGDAELVEGNWWGDRYWGVCDGFGENQLGKILMSVRSRLVQLESQ